MTSSRFFTFGTDLFLGLLFAFIFAVCMKAAIASDYLSTGQVVRPQDISTISICVLAAFLSALIAWWLQIYASGSNLIARMFFALVMIVVSYCAIGGILVVLSNIFVYGNQNTASEGVLIDGFFWESISGFYAFAIFSISAMNLALIGLFAAAAFYVGLLGPRSTRPAPELVLRTGA